MELAPVDGPGWMSSMSTPLPNSTCQQLLQLASHPRDQVMTKMTDDLRHLSARCAGRWGVAVAITIDALNLCMQLRGDRAFLDIYDHPDELAAFLQAGVDVNIKLVEQQRAAIDMTCEGGVYDFFNAGWGPNQTIPMSVDCYNLCSPDVYAQFGLHYQQQLIDHFGGANLHVHGNGRQLLDQLAKLRGTVVALIADDGADIAALDDLEAVKRRLGAITPVVSCTRDPFVRRLREKSLVGGVFYRVEGLKNIEQANRLMDSVRSYTV
ncbi:MAG: hypothetical protein CMJ49_02595 [Planctomycetaceae bacterium]|nr:hypothetical protein [Planctomycetaceae bacterium]